MHLFRVNAGQCAHHKEKVFAVNDILLQDDLCPFKLTEFLYIVEIRNVIVINNVGIAIRSIPVSIQGTDCIDYIGEKHHLCIMTYFCGQFHYASRVGYRRSYASEGFILYPPALIVSGSQGGYIAFQVFVTKESAVNLISVAIVENHHIQVVNAGFVGRRGFCFGADIKLQHVLIAEA